MVLAWELYSIYFNILGMLHENTFCHIKIQLARIAFCIAAFVLSLHLQKKPQ
jgi:hypothetical protein